MNQNEKWYFARGKDTVGPMSLADLRSALLRGEVKAGDLVYHEMLGQWTPAGKVAILQDAFTAAPPVAGPPLTIKTSQPRNNGPKSMGPPTGKIVIKSELKTEQASPAIDLGLNINPSGKVESKKSEPVKSEAKKSDSSKSDSAKADQPAGAGTLFDVSGDISEPDEIIEGEANIAGGQMLLEKGTPLDFIPNMLRAGFPGMVANSMGKFFASAGIWIQILCLLGVGMSIILMLIRSSMSSSEVSADLMYSIAFLVIPIFLILSTSYINFRLMPSLNRLNTLGEGRMASNALPDSISVLFLGLGAGSVFALMFIGLGSRELIGVAVCVLFCFLVFGALAFCAVTAANPGALNMTIDGSLSPSAEAAGAVQYLSKLFLRLSLGLYGFAMTLLVLGILFTDILMFFGQRNAGVFSDLVTFVIVIAWIVVAVGFLPLCAYITFLGVQFFLDFAIKVVQNTRR